MQRGIRGSAIGSDDGRLADIRPACTAQPDLPALLACDRHGAGRGERASRLLRPRDAGGPVRLGARHPRADADQRPRTPRARVHHIHADGSGLSRPNARTGHAGGLLLAARIGRRPEGSRLRDRCALGRRRLEDEPRPRPCDERLPPRLPPGRPHGQDPALPDRHGFAAAAHPEEATSLVLGACPYTDPDDPDPLALELRRGVVERILERTSAGKADVAYLPDPANPVRVLVRLTERDEPRRRPRPTRVRFFGGAEEAAEAA